MSGRPWFKFYPRDFAGNPKLLRLTRGARAMLLELMCLAHEQTQYGVIPDDVLAGYLAGDAEGHALLDILVKNGIVHEIPGTHSIVMRRLTRDHQRSVDGGKSRLKRADLAGDLSGKTRTTRSQKPEPEKISPTASGASPASNGHVAAPKEPAKKRTPAEHVQVVEFWIKCWAFYRHNVPKDECMAWTFENKVGIPPEALWLVKPRDWAAAAKLWNGAGKNLAEIQKRMMWMLEQDTEWIAQNASLSLLDSKWNQFDPRTQA